MSAARAMTTSEQEPARESIRPACPHCGDSGRRSVRGRPDGHLVTACEACGHDVEDLGIYDEMLRAAEKARLRAVGGGDMPLFGSVGAAIGWYLRQRERLMGSRSLDDMLAERLAYGCAIKGGSGSTREPRVLQVARIAACLPDTTDTSGRPVVEAEVALAMLLLTTGGGGGGSGAGSGGGGLGREAAAALCRERWGAEWGDQRCRALLQRALAETRARMQERGILRRGWGG
jgi:predicted RNA-binding Zn-ribbon protein involved in translation (DUF1610 family)